LTLPSPQILLLASSWYIRSSLGRSEHNRVRQSLPSPQILLLVGSRLVIFPLLSIIQDLTGEGLEPHQSSRSLYGGVEGQAGLSPQVLLLVSAGDVGSLHTSGQSRGGHQTGRPGLEERIVAGLLLLHLSYRLNLLVISEHDGSPEAGQSRGSSSRVGMSIRSAAGVRSRGWPPTAQGQAAVSSWVEA